MAEVQNMPPGLYLVGRIHSAGRTEKVTNRKTGEVYPPYDWVQVIVPRRGEQDELVTFTVADCKPFEARKGQLSTFPVRASANGGAVRFFAAD